LSVIYSFVSTLWSEDVGFFVSFTSHFKYKIDC
jgi:hypothetical protein